MDYRQASNIRKTGLIKLIATRKFEGGQGIGRAIGSSISDKFKAKAVGMKEAMDPLNWVRKITGKGTFGDIMTTMAGRAFGRSDDTISYFGGFKRKTKNKDPQLTTIGPGPIKPLKMNDSLADILAKMYNFMTKTSEDRIKQQEIEKSFRQEQLDEDERRHQELVTAIKKFTGEKQPDVKKESGNSIIDMVKGMFDKLSGMFADLVTKLGPLLRWAGAMSWTGLKWLASFVTSAGGILLGATIAGAVLALKSQMSAEEKASKKAKEVSATSNSLDEVRSAVMGTLAEDIDTEEGIEDQMLISLRKENTPQAKKNLELLEKQIKEGTSRGQIERNFYKSIGYDVSDKYTYKAPKKMGTFQRSHVETERKDYVKKQLSRVAAGQKIQTFKEASPDLYKNDVNPGQTERIHTPPPKVQPVHKKVSDIKPTPEMPGTGPNWVQPVVNVNNVTKNNKGKEDRIVSTSTPKQRNTDLSPYLSRSAHAV